MSTMESLPVSIAECLSHFAKMKPQTTALTIVDSQGDTPYSYAELEARAKAIAAFMQQSNKGSVVGERALLLMNTSVEYVTAFLACQYAGVVAVPIFPPESVRELHMARLRVVASDADARWIMTSTDVASALAKAQHTLSDADLLIVDQVDLKQAEHYQS
ncbi:MAG: AMP-binding protein, partial [Bermanella sp.]